MSMTKARREKKNQNVLLKKQRQEKELPRLKKDIVKALNNKIKEQPDTPAGGVIKDECLVLIGKINLEDLSFKNLLKIQREIK